MLNQGRNRVLGRIWRLSLAVVLIGGLSTAFAASASSSGPRAQASADVLLETMTVIRPIFGSPASDYERTSSTDFIAGTRYRIVVSGTVSQRYSGQQIDIDALYCFANFNTPAIFGSCTPPRRGTPLRFSIGGGVPLELDKLIGYSGPELPYAADHLYAVSVQAAVDGPLVVSQLAGLIDSAPGAWIIQIYGPAPAPGPPSPSPGTPVTGQDVPTVVPAAKSWGVPVSSDNLPAGGTAVVQSPKLAPGQKQLKIDVKTGTSAKDVPLVVLRRRASDCIQTFVTEIQQLRLASNEHGTILVSESGYAEAEDDVPFLQLIGLLACLEELREAAARQTGGASSAVAMARTRCRSDAVKLNPRYNRESRRARYRMQRPSRSVRKLRITCRVGRRGLSVRVRTRSRRTKLRSLLGPRAIVGVYRPHEATGEGVLRAVFKR
jgi:hypothetical protein